MFIITTHYFILQKLAKIINSSVTLLKANHSGVFAFTCFPVNKFVNSFAPMDIGHFGLVLDTRSFFCRFVYLLSMDSQMTLTDPIITWNVTEEKPSYAL